ncbi:MAG: MerR family transcriptional regulator [Candidatus Kapaibacterium sp.]
MSEPGVRIGRLAEQTGLSIRTLHWYDEIGLLKPTERTESGHRIYSREDVARLQQILSLRDLGFALEEIAECLDDRLFDHYTVVRMHRIRLQRDLERTRQLCERLERLEHQLEQGDVVSSEEFIQTIESIIMTEKYYTKEQQEYLKNRYEEVGEERIQQVQKEWEELIAAARSEMEKGSDPMSQPVLEIARKWNALVDEFTGGNPGVTASLKQMYNEEGPEKASRGMMDPAIFEFMREPCERVRGTG